MWVIFRKSDKQVVGKTAHSTSAELDKDDAIAEVLRRKLTHSPAEDLDAVQVLEREEVMAVQATGLGRKLVIEEIPGGILRPKVEITERFLLQLSTNVSSTHPVDEVPLIPGDGESSVEITIQKIDMQGQPVARAQDNDEVWLRATHGTLLDVQGTPVYSLRLSRGEAAFRFRSEKAARLAVVRVFNGDPFLEDAAVTIELVPPSVQLPLSQPDPGGVEVPDPPPIVVEPKEEDPSPEPDPGDVVKLAPAIVAPTSTREVTDITGIGSKLGARLAEHDVHTVGDLLGLELEQLAAILGTSSSRAESFVSLAWELLGEDDDE